MATAKQVAELNAAILDTCAAHLAEITGAPIIGDDVRAGLAVALAEHFCQAGGVLLVWWDREGLKMNAGRYLEVATVDQRQHP